MIDANQFGLGDWKLVESSEQAMLAELGRAEKRQRWLVFLGWTPHPMNIRHDLRYLEGGEQYFGDRGQVYTLARRATPRSARTRRGCWPTCASTWTWRTA